MKNCKLIAIAAVSIDGAIGIDNEIPWQIPEDLKHFRNTTMGNPLIVGYSTFITLPEKALEGREYFVLNGGNHFENDRNNVYQFKDLDELFSFIDFPVIGIGFNEKETFYVAGGAMIYDSLIEYCEEAIITWVIKSCPNANKLFPIDKLFSTFDAVNEVDWQRSASGALYKISYYKKCEYE